LIGAQHIIAGVVTFTALTSYVNYRFIKLPKSVGLTLITFILALIVRTLGAFYPAEFETVIAFTSNVDFNQALLHGMIGFLLFAGALQVNMSDLLADKWLIATLATLSVFISAIIIGATTWCLAQIFSFNIPLSYALMFGALISPTDPIAVMSILKKNRVDKSLKIKFAGEALFNDGIGIVLFIGFMGLASEQYGSFKVSELFLYFLRETLGGVVIGLILGKFVVSLLRTITQFEEALLVTLALVTGGYYFADIVIDVSGVISIAIAGIMIGANLDKLPMSKREILQLKDVWKVIDELLNALLFVLIGLEFLSLHFTADVIILCIGIIAMVVVSRWISIALPISIVPAFRNKNPFNVIWLLSWGGVRGGISIALALSIPMDSEARDLIIAITYGVVLFSLAVQGLTIGPLMKKLKYRHS
jgi:CPA1 family monovalent cation:H+ antiporter